MASTHWETTRHRTTRCCQEGHRFTVRHSQLPFAGKGLWLESDAPSKSRLCAYGGKVRDFVPGEKRNYSFAVSAKQVVDADDTQTRGLGAFANTLRGDDKVSRAYNSKLKPYNKAVSLHTNNRKIKGATSPVELFCGYGSAYKIKSKPPGGTGTPHRTGMPAAGKRKQR